MHICPKALVRISGFDVGKISIARLMGEDQTITLRFEIIQGLNHRIIDTMRAKAAANDQILIFCPYQEEGFAPPGKIPSDRVSRENDFFMRKPMSRIPENRWQFYPPIC